MHVGCQLFSAMREKKVFKIWEKCQQKSWTWRNAWEAIFATLMLMLLARKKFSFAFSIESGWSAPKCKRSRNGWCIYCQHINSLKILQYPNHTNNCSLTVKMLVNFDFCLKRKRASCCCWCSPSCFNFYHLKITALSKSKIAIGLTLWLTSFVLYNRECLVGHFINSILHSLSRLQVSRKNPSLPWSKERKKSSFRLPFQRDFSRPQLFFWHSFQLWPLSPSPRKSPLFVHSSELSFSLVRIR